MKPRKQTCACGAWVLPGSKPGTLCWECILDNERQRQEQRRRSGIETREPGRRKGAERG